MSILVLDTPKAKVGLTGDEQNLSTDVLNMLEEVVVVKVGHMLRIRGAGEGLEYKDEVQEANKGCFLSVPAGHLAGAHHGQGGYMRPLVHYLYSSRVYVLIVMAARKSSTISEFTIPILYRNVGPVRVGKTGGLPPC